MLARDIVERMETTKNSGVFVLGCYERRVSVVSQQIRALNLIHSLFACGRLSSGHALLVIGAGVAGLTAAAGAAVRGCTVEVFEREDCEIPLFKNSRRYLHPYAYDWPGEEWYVNQAQIPLMYWSAAEASTVRDALLLRWKDIQANCRLRPIVHPNVSFALDPNTPKHVRWTANGTSPHAKDFDIIILAVGFGQERPRQQNVGMQPHAYWDTPAFDRTATKKYLISGCGDGASADLLQVCHGPTFSPILDYLFHSDLDFENARKTDPEAAIAQGERLVEELQTVKQELLRIEQHTASLQPGDVAKYLWVEYSKLSAPLIDRYLKDRLLLRGSVVLNGKTKYPLQPNASIYHRFVVSRLLMAPDVPVEYQPGLLKPVSAPSQPGGKYTAKFEFRGRASIDAFDEVIIRHGPEPEPAALEFRGRMRHFSELFDKTRDPTWQPGDFRLKEQSAAAIRYLESDWGSFLSKLRDSRDDDDSFLARRVHERNDNMAHAFRLAGASGVWYPPDRVRCYYQDISFTMPREFEPQRNDVLRSLRVKHAESGADFFDGPCARLVAFRAPIQGQSEDQHLILHFGPLGWYDYSVIEELLQRSRHTHAEGPQINLARLVKKRDLRESSLHNIVDTTTTVVTSDAHLLYARRSEQVSVDEGRMTTAVAENINREKDKTTKPWGISLDPFNTVRRGIEEEMSAELVAGRFSWTAYLIGLCYGLQSLHPTLIFIAAVDATSTKIDKVCRENPGKHYHEGWLKRVSADGNDPELVALLSSADWVTGGKAAVIRAVEFLASLANRDPNGDLGRVIKRLARGEEQLD